MIKVLHIARYRNMLLERKVDLMSQDHDFTFFRVRPKSYEDAYGSRTSQYIADSKHNRLFVSLIGKNIDPHRVLYGSFSFSMSHFKPDLIHAEDEPDSLAALQVLLAWKLFSPKAKLILHTWQNVNRRKRPLVRWVTNTSIKASTAILCSNIEGVTILGDMGFKGIVDIVPPEGVDVEWFKPPQSRKKNEKFSLLYAGRFAEEKGLDTLLKAIKLAQRDVVLALVGDGHLKHTLMDLAKNLGIHDKVQFLPPVKQDAMPDLYAGADALVLPSRGTPVWKEQYGRVLLEAMACKVPVIGSDSGAIPEVIGDAGLIFQEDDADSLSLCIQKLIDNPSIHKDLMEQGYERATSLFSQHEIAKRTNEFYHKVIGW